MNQERYQFSQQVTPNLPRPFQRPDYLKEPLYVITPIFNSQRFRSRWRLYSDFCKMVAEAGALLTTIEIAFGERDFVVTQNDTPDHIQLRTSHEIWLKEAAINLAVQRLPLDWKYVAWIDADCMFARNDWADETRHLLQHYPVIQMWSQLHDLNSEHELQGTNKSFASVWMQNGSKLGGDPSMIYPLENNYALGQSFKNKYPGAPGLAWAMRREAWDQLGGLIDYCVLGAGDWYMAHALTGQLHRVSKPDSTNLARKMQLWQNAAETSLWNGRPIIGNLGCMKGVVLHYWHGPKAHRRYGTREQILINNQFDPDLDLRKDWQGLYQLTNRVPQLRRDIQGYFGQRNEDQLTIFND